MASNYDIAHAWAHNDDRRHGSGNFTHKYGKLYSYSTVIGQRLEVNGNIVFIVNTYSYSHSTFKHQGYMENAIPKGDNIFTFSDPSHSNYYGMIDTYRMSDTALVVYGLKMLARSYADCVAVASCNSMKHGFSCEDFKEMLRWFKVTGCITLPKLLRLSAKDFELNYSFNYGKYDIPDARHFKAFVKAMADGKPLEEIVDLVNGKGTWQAYLDRTNHLRLAKKYRQWSMKLGFLTPQNQCSTYSWGDGKERRYPVVKGSVTSKEVQKHRKAGDLIPWMLQLKRHNEAEADKNYEFRTKRSRIQRAKQRLEEHIGMRGFLRKWSPFYHCERVVFSSFNYDGTTISFSGTTYYKERELSGDEYKAFREMDCDEQRRFIHEKRLWMLAQLQNDKHEYDTREARWAEEARQWEAERLERERLLNEKREYIDALKAQGDEGCRQLYHECLPVSLPYGNAPVYYGGNVLLHFNAKANLIETSKSVKLSVDEARKLWVFVSRCHETGGANAKGLEVHCTNYTYTVHSYENDILTVGCHQIAYPEMAYMAKQLNFV